MAAPKGNQYAKGNEGGRPEKYTDEWLREEAKELLAWIEKPSNYFLNGFAYQRGYSPKRLPEFTQKSKEFSDSYEIAKWKQSEKFAMKALTREWDPGFTKYTMARVCGDEWKNSWDREEDKGAAPTTVIINKIEK